MMKARYNPLSEGNFIKGKFQQVTESNLEWICRSPADFSDEIGKVQSSYSSVESAVQSAREAFQAWRRLKNSERATFLKKFQSILLRREEDLIEIIAREVGKPKWEAKIEVAGMVEQIETTLQESLKYVTDFSVSNIKENTDGFCQYRPKGVLAVIGPFNLPGGSPTAHIVPALITGNTIVFKPSEKTPFTGQLLAECFSEAGIPAGVFNLIQGEREVGRRLCVHEGIDGILFTGSYEVGTRIKQDTLQQHWKLLVLEMGGKNPAIIWDDAQIELAVYSTLVGAFATTGQRCTSTSRIIVHESILDQFVSQFHQRAKAFSIGHPFLNNSFMGPLIDEGSVDRYMKFLGIAVREGCELLMRGKAMESAVRGNYVTPSICVAQNLSVEQTRKSIYQQTEIFAPNVLILGVKDMEQAIAQANASQYGLVASIFTQSRSTYEKMRDELEVGMIHWNKSTVGTSPRLPFGGLKKSGNHFPTALTSTLYCTNPISTLEIETVGDFQQSISKTPGLNWK